MRALNLCGVLVVGSIIVVACGGQSDIPITGPGGLDGGEGGGVSKGDAGSGGDGGPGNPGTSRGGTPSATGGSSSGTGGTSATGGSPAEGGTAPSAGKSGKAGGPSTGGSSAKGGSPATGGMAQAGEAGAAGSPECTKTQDGKQGSDFCSAQVRCPGGVQAQTFCYNNGAGTWWCDCSGSIGYRQYQVSGLAGTAVCDAVADVCAQGESPVFNGPEECSTSVQYRRSNNCEIEQTCVQSVKLTDEIDATLSKRNYVSCGDGGSGRMYCYCDYGGEFQISGQDGTQACDTMLEFCSGEIDFGEEPSCMSSHQSAGNGFCQAAFACTRSVEVDGATVIHSEPREVTCQTATSGGSNCACFTNRAQLRFDIESPTSGVGTCNTYASLCDDFDSIELSGDVQCAPAYQSSSGDYCDASIECKQPGTINGEQVFAYGTLSASCSRSGDAFSCFCSSSNESAEIAVDASTAWDACSAAVSNCPDVVTVTIGEGGGVILPPIPRPID